MTVNKEVPMVNTDWGRQPAWVINPGCGNRAVWDTPSQMGYRCSVCFAMLGSIGMPQECIIDD